MNHHSSRRELLRWGLRGTAMAVAGLAEWQPLLYAAAARQAAGIVRTNTSSRIGLELDGQFAGWVESVRGGGLLPDIGIEKAAPRPQLKHIANLKYEDISISCGAGISQNFYEWIKASVSGGFISKNVSIVTCDYNYRQVERMNAFKTLVSEVVFPACDASSRGATQMTVQLTPEAVQVIKVVQGAAYGPGPSARVPPYLSAANFLLQIPGIDCSHVNTIAAIQEKMHYSEMALGVRVRSGQAEVPNLSLTVPENYAAGFFLWYKNFVIDGNNGPAAEKDGELGYLSPNLRDPLFVVKFGHLGISKLTTLTTGAPGVRLVQVEMYCRSLGFDFTAAAFA